MASIRSLISSQTPMLTLNQKLHGEQPIFKPVRKHRIYRAGEKPNWIKKHNPKEKTNSELKSTRDEPQLLSENSIKEVVKNKSQIVGEDLSSSEEEPKEIEEIDISKLKVTHLSEEEGIFGKEEKTKLIRREMLKKSLLKNLEMKESIRELQEEKEENLEDKKKDDQNEKIDDKPSKIDEDYSDSSLDGEDYAEEIKRRLYGEKPKFITKTRRIQNSHPETQTNSTKSSSINQSSEKSNELALSLKTTHLNGTTEESQKHREQSVQLLIELSRHEQKQAEKERENQLANLPDDNDAVGEDAETEFESWKLRELTRMKEDIVKRTAFAEEQAVVLKRRSMDDEQRELDNVQAGSKRYEKKQEKIAFLQKYHHKGAFFQNDDLVQKKLMERNFMAPVGEDKYTDRTLLPKIMQVKDFGQGSRTKYTHLVDQDTTFGSNKAPVVLGRRDITEGGDGIESAPIMGDYRNPVNPWMDFRSARVRRFKGAAPENAFERPSKKRKVK